MNELIRTLALLGRPFPPELRELYLQVDNRSKRHRGARAGQMLPKANCLSGSATPPSISRISRRSSCQVK